MKTVNAYGFRDRIFVIISLMFLMGSMLIMGGEIAHAAPQAKIKLTDAERDWLARHPRIQVGIMDAWPPLNYLDQSKTPQGIGAEYLAALNKRLGGALVPVPAPFKENYDRVLNGHLDAIMDITQRPDREALFNFTRPYIVIPHAIVGRKGGEYFKNEQYLSGKTIALERGFYNVTYFKNNYPAVKIREFASTSEALDAVSRGEADAYAGNRAVIVYLIEKELLNNLRLMGKLTEPNSTLQFGTQKGNPLLASILDKALASMTSEEERAIRQKWLQETSPGLDLTEAEQRWLDKHPNIRVALDPAWAPVEFLDKHGIPQGISPEYLKKIGEQLGVRFEIVTGRSRQQMTAAVKNHELDMFSAIARTPERERFLSFSDAYLSLPTGIFTLQEAHFIGSIKELSGKKVAVNNGRSAEFQLRTNFPELQLNVTQNSVEALQKLAHGDVDAFVGNTMTTGFYLGELGLTNIKLAGEAPFRYELSMGIRNDWPELTTILNKALRSIPETERDAIYRKWTTLQFKQKVDYSVIWRIVIGALAVVVLFAFWNRRLGREVSIRKVAEAQLQANQAHLEQLLEERTLNAAELREAKEHAETADKLKSAFLATMSHELRTPLNSIIGFTGILLQGMGGPVNEEQIKQLTMVKNSANHLLSLISDVLDISKIEAGQLKVSVEPFNLQESIQKVVQSVRPLAEKNGLYLTLDMAGDVGSIVTDERRVEQILLNLLSNALKFTEQGGISVRCKREAGYYVTTVTDTGIGIKEGDLDRLFKPFHQIDSGLSRKYAGTGLGLSICMRLAELMGGEIGVRSKFGEGSTFWLTLPVETGSAQPGDKPSVPDLHPGEKIPGAVDDGAALKPIPSTTLPIDREKLETAYQQLVELLRDDDASAGDLLDENFELLKNSFPQEFPVIEGAIRRFDFEAAVAALVKARKNFDDKEEMQTLPGER